MEVSFWRCLLSVSSRRVLGGHVAPATSWTAGDWRLIDLLPAGMPMAPDHAAWANLHTYIYIYIFATASDASYSYI